MKNTIEIATLANWSSPKTVTTRNGDRLLRTASPTDAFSAAWKADKEAMRAAGLSWSKDNRTGEWQVCWWQQVGAATSTGTVAQSAPEGLSAEDLARFAAIEPKLLAYQRNAVKTLATALVNFKGALDASDTGTGKTFVSFAAALVLGRPVFVVCPKAVIPSWKRAAKHFNAEVSAINYELLRRGDCPEVSSVKDAKGATQFTFNLPTETVIIFDECHRMKDGKTLNNSLGMAALRQGYMVVGLSATAADNPMQMKFVARLTNQISDEKQFWGWMMRNGVTRGRFGLEFNGSKTVLAALHHRIFPEHGSRLRIADLGDAFPETQIAAEEYDLNGAGADIQKVLEEMEVELAALEASEAQDKGACILTARLRARQRAETLKVPAIAALAQDQIEEGMSVALFVNFDSTLQALASKLNTTCVVHGSQTAEQREAAVAAFQSDSSPVIICNIRAGGVGISLHGSATARMRYSIICPSDSSQDMKQALGRVWRANGAKSIQRIFLAAGTIEKKVYANALNKIDRIDMLNDGDGSAKPEAKPATPAAPAPTTVQIPAETAQASSRARSNGQAGQSGQTGSAIAINEALRAHVHEGLRFLAGRCNYGQNHDGAGFSKFDANFGHSLADKTSLTDNMVVVGMKLVNKYRKQLGATYMERLEALK